MKNLFLTMFFLFPMLSFAGGNDMINCPEYFICQNKVCVPNTNQAGATYFNIVSSAPNGQYWFNTAISSTALNQSGCYYVDPKNNAVMQALSSIFLVPQWLSQLPVDWLPRQYGASKYICQNSQSGMCIFTRP